MLLRYISIGLCVLIYTASTAQAEEYSFPINNNLAATVIGTPDEFTAQLEPLRRTRSERRLDYDKSREIPDLFWFANGLNYTVVTQSVPAPLMISIAGTGASNRSSKMKLIERAYFAKGFHVLSLPSPTHSDFIVNASTSGLPSLPEEDAKDLYRVMQQAIKEVSGRADITEYHLVGYSLGGTQAAFVAKLDEEEKAIGFKKVLLLNPSVSLYNSVKVFDDMAKRGFPTEDSLNLFYERLMRAFAREMYEEDFTEITSDVLYEIYRDRVPSDQKLEQLIALAFRISLSNMIFTADIISKSGYMIPANYKLDKYASLTDLKKVSMRQSFVDYFDNMVYPHYKHRFGTRKAMVHAASLNSIKDYLKTAAHIGVLTNADDPIYVEGEVDFIKSTFGQRAIVFPNGGHLGNMYSRWYVAKMQSFFGDANE